MGLTLKQACLYRFWTESTTSTPIGCYTGLPNTHSQCFRKWNLAMRTWRSKALQWEKKRMRPKCGPKLELLRTSSRYFHQNAMKSLKSTFRDKSAMLVIMEGMIYNPISQAMHALTLVLNLIDIFSPFSQLHCNFSFMIGKMRPFVWNAA